MLLQSQTHHLFSNQTKCSNVWVQSLEDARPGVLYVGEQGHLHLPTSLKNKVPTALSQCFHHQSASSTRTRPSAEHHGKGRGCLPCSHMGSHPSLWPQEQQAGDPGTEPNVAVHPASHSLLPVLSPARSNSSCALPKEEEKGNPPDRRPRAGAEDTGLSLQLPGTPAPLELPEGSWNNFVEQGSITLIHEGEGSRSGLLGGLQGRTEPSLLSLLARAHADG